MSHKQRIYFISDLHLGMSSPEQSLRREKLVVRWLEEIGKDASELWMLGDIFDFWFEYSKVVPRGFTRFLGKLASLSDQGVKIHLITGNHDIWTFDYLIKEIGLEIHRKSLMKTWNNHLFLLGHGDGLHKNDFKYRMLQGVFKNRHGPMALCQAPPQWNYYICPMVVQKESHEAWRIWNFFGGR